MSYTWHRKKAEANIHKHGINFADAVGVFEDDNLLWQEDVDAYDEVRFIALGADYLGRILVVVFTMDEETIRIISARKADKYERETYEERRRFA
jgi:uncharacterized DUF497 family protein